MFTKKEAVNIIQGNTEMIKAYGVKKIGIFGSFAKRTQHNKSDIDILVEFRDGQKIFDNYIELKFLLERLFRRKVDLVIKDALRPRIKPYINKEVEYARL
jgi:predicted nucleotidyltransferase